MSTRTARNIGVPWVRPPSRSCDDDKCPWHGSVPVRGRLMEAVVVGLRSRRIAVVERIYYQYQPKFMRYERRRSMIHAYVPTCVDVKEGDSVYIGETRPLAKSVAFVVLGRSGGAS
ncbi:MAG: 30S ribosomal protein S17 [Nitrososphaeria archaeon]